MIYKINPTSQDFRLTTNPKHFSNTDESHVLEGSREPYVIKQRQILKCSTDHKSLVTMDTFTGQITATGSCTQCLQRSKHIANFPANMRKFYQPLGLTVNGYCK